MSVQETTITVATETTIVTSGQNNALVGLVITFGGTQAAGTITIKESTGGTVRMIIDYPNSATLAQAPFTMFLPSDRWLYQNAIWAPWQSNYPYALGIEVRDPSNHIQKVTTGGASASSVPTWNDAGGTTADGTVVWTDQGAAAYNWTATCSAGAAGMPYHINAFYLEI